MSIYPVAGRYYAACILFGLLCVHPGGGALYGRTRRYSLVYVSPVQGAMYVHAAETIIMRAVSPVWPGDASRFVRRITGSKSGVHGFTATVSDDDRTVICRPQNPFFSEEEVTVDLDTDIVTYPLPGGVPHAWSFRTGTPGTSMPGLRERLMGSGIPRVLLPVRAPLAAVSAPAPGDPSPPAVHVLFPGQPSTGELYLSNLYWNNYTVQYLLILTNDGTPVFAREMDVDCYDFKPQPNGYSTYYYGQDGFGFFKEMDDTYTVIDSFKCGNGYITDPHDFILLPDGHAMFLGTDPEVIDMSGVVPGGSHAARVIGLVIQELDQSKQVVFQWRSWDHFNITDAWHIALNASYIDYVHGNSLDLDSDGNIILSSRHLNEITKINRETGGIIWRLGGANNQFTFLNDTLGFSYQHCVRRLPNGHITLFDNGDFHVPSFSRALEYALDEQAKTATLVWQYRDTPDVYGFAMGDVQRLSNGNTLIGWGAANPTVTEVDSSGRKVYEMSLDPGIYSYRTVRSDVAPVETGVPRAPLPASFSLAQNYPNPFNPSTVIQYSIPARSRVTLDVVDILGRVAAKLVDGEEAAGMYSERFDGTGLASGVYFYRLRAGEFTQIKRMLLIR